MGAIISRQFMRTMAAVMPSDRHHDPPPPEVSAAFLVAAGTGDLSKVKSLSLSPDSVDCRSAMGGRALFLAVYGRHNKVVNLLLQRGTSTESIERTASSTPLHLAAGLGYLGTVVLLCQHGADVDAQDKAGLTPLRYAVDRGHIEVVLYLLKRGAHPDALHSDIKTPLLIAWDNQDAAMVACLLQHGADVYCRGPAWEDRSVFVNFARAREQDFIIRVVEALVERGVTDVLGKLVNSPRFGGLTPLHVAAANEKLRLVECLIDHSANLEATTSEGYSALLCATYNGHVNIVKYLLHRGADMETANIAGDTPLLVASSNGFVDVVNELLQRRANVQHKNIKGYSALHCAVNGGRLRVVDVLLSHGASASSRDHQGWTPLMLAAKCGHVETVVRLLDIGGADVNCYSDDFQTPLAIAASQNHESVCKVLLGRGASTTGQRTDGSTPLHAAVWAGGEATVRLLLEHGADPSFHDFDGRTPAHVAVMEGHFGIAALLSESGYLASEHGYGIWRLHSLLELYHGSGDEIQQLHKNPSWFIHRSSIKLIGRVPVPVRRWVVVDAKPPAAEVSVGTWMGSRVVVVELNLESERLDKHVMQREFRREVSRYYPLRHPHIIKLYGACHRGDRPFVVMEYAEKGTFSSFVNERKHRVWSILHKIALSVQYLHERGIVHGMLTAESILVGSDGEVKLTGLGPLSTFDMNAFEKRQVERSFEDDVAALGHLMVQAVCGSDPYPVTVSSRTESVAGPIFGWHPRSKPKAFSDREWEIVSRMTCSNSLKRLTISDVVRELDALRSHEATVPKSLVDDLHKEKNDVGRAYAEAARVSKKLCISEVARLQERQAIARQRVLATTDRRNDAPSDTGDLDQAFKRVQILLGINKISEEEPSSSERMVYGRLHNFWQAIQRLSSKRQSRAAQVVANILTRFGDSLERWQGMNKTASIAAMRQSFERTFAFHNEIDDLLLQYDQDDVVVTATVRYRNVWRDRWAAFHRERMECFRTTTFDRITQLNVESATHLLAELTMRRDFYTSILPVEVYKAIRTLRAQHKVHVPNWFLPYYEVNFDDAQSFSRGGCGSVHHGEWMGSRVVVKIIFAKDDSPAFETEVEIWSSLYHPHVLQLFGANHVGRKFIVSELAAHGQLDQYLGRLKRTLPGTKYIRELWRALYEAALGLEYLHSCDVVHCDIKGNNFLVGSDGRIKVADYGLSRVSQAAGEQEQSTCPYAVGAPRWKAPEVLNGSVPTVTSDIFGFGMVVVEVVTGEFPWGMDVKDVVVSDHVRRGDELLKLRRDELHPMFTELQWEVVTGACRHDPSQRLSMADIVAKLKVCATQAACMATDDETKPPCLDQDETGAKVAAPVETYNESW